MANLPKFYRSSAGMRYFVVNGRKVFIEPGVSKKQILSIYKTLKKTIKTKKRKPKTNKQSAQTVININNEPKRRNRSNRNRKYVKFGSTINPLLQSISSGFTKDSGDIDLVNKSINEFNKKLDDDKRKLDEEKRKLEENKDGQLIVLPQSVMNRELAIYQNIQYAMNKFRESLHRENFPDNVEEAKSSKFFRTIFKSIIIIYVISITDITHYD